MRKAGSRRGPPSETDPVLSALAGRQDAHDLAAAALPELHVPGDQRVQRVVAAPADQVARVELGAALADEDLAGVDQLPPVPSRWAADSRPLRELDAPFLCAISYFPLSMPVTLTWVSG